MKLKYLLAACILICKLPGYCQKLPLPHFRTRAAYTSSIDIRQLEVLEKNFSLDTGLVRKKSVENDHLIRDTSRLYVPGNRKGRTFDFRRSSDGRFSPRRNVDEKATGSGFVAIVDNNTSIPPDCTGAAGERDVMTALNTEVRVQDKAGAIVTTVSLDGFFADSVHKPNVFDPRLLYDPVAKRWIFIAVANSNSDSAQLLVAISESDRPLTWKRYYFRVDTNGEYWLDYPSLGINKNWIVVTGNLFSVDSRKDLNQNYGSQVYVFNKDALYLGIENVSVFNRPSSEGYTICPAVTFDNELETEYLISSFLPDQAGIGYLRLYTITGTPASPEFTATNIYPSVLGGWADLPENGFNDFAPQDTVVDLIMNNDSRIQNAVYRNGRLWCTQTIFLPTLVPNHSTIQWWEIDPSTGDALQLGRIEDRSGKTYYAFPSIAVNSSNDMVIGYSSFSSKQFATMNYSYRMHDDAPNTVRRSEQVRAGIGKYYKIFNGDKNRWGDYTTTCLDPDGKTFWLLGEYSEPASVRTVDYGVWGTYWYNLKLPR